MDLTHYIDLLKAVACVVVPVVIWSLLTLKGHER